MKKNKTKKSKKSVLQVGKVLDAEIGKFKTPKAMLSFPSLFKPEAFQDNAPKYKCTLIFDTDDVDLFLLKKVGKKAIKSWGKKVKKNFKMPYHDGDERDQEGYGEGKEYITCSSTFPVAIYDKKGNEITDETEIYPGCVVRAIIKALVYEGKGSTGLTFVLLAVQKLGDGEKIGMSVSADDFGSDDLSDFDDDDDDDDLDDDDNWDDDDE